MIYHPSKVMISQRIACKIMFCITFLKKFSGFPASSNKMFLVRKSKASSKSDHPLCITPSRPVATPKGHSFGVTHSERALILSMIKKQKQKRVDQENNRRSINAMNTGC